MADKPKTFKQGMTLMPGESAKVTFSLPPGPELAKLVEGLKPGDRIPLEMVEVPPPDEAPLDPEADALGLERGLQVGGIQSDSFRCAECGNMQPAGVRLIWVPDGLYRGAGSDLVQEMCRRNAYNGHSGGWCLKCAKTLGHRISWPKLAEAELIGDEKKLPSEKLLWIILAILAVFAVVTVFAVAMLFFLPHWH